MKNSIYIVFFIASIGMYSQIKESDYNVFYKGGKKHLKPVKYVFFDSLSPNAKRKKDRQNTYFYIMGESFVYKKNYTLDTCAISFLKNIKLDNPVDLQKNAYKYFEKKKQELENKTNNRIHILYPITDFSSYFKIYVLEKIDNNRLIKYEVDWEYYSF